MASRQHRARLLRESHTESSAENIVSVAAPPAGVEDVRPSAPASSLLSESDQSYDDRRRMVQAAIDSTVPNPAGNGIGYAWISDLWDDKVVYTVQGPSGEECYQRSYVIDDDNKVTLGDTEHVTRVTKYEKVTESDLPLYEGRILESVGASGRDWKVVIVEPGVSLMGVNYTPAVLQEATAKYANAPVFADHDHADSNLPERSVRDKVGVIKKPHYGTEEVDGKMVEGIHGRITVVAPWLRESLREAHEAGEANFFGLSHTIEPGGMKQVLVGGRRVREPTSIRKVHSVDVVTTASAGGRFTQLIASNRPESGGTELDDETKKLIEEQVEARVAATLAAQQEAAVKAAQEAADAQAKAVADAAAADAEKAAVATATAPEAPELAAVTESQRRIEAELAELRKDRWLNQVETALRESNISEFSKDMLRERFVALDGRDLEGAALRAAITKTQEHEARLVQEAHNPKVRAVTLMGANETDNFDLRLQGFFSRLPLKDANGDTVKPFTSLQEAYCQKTGTPFWEFDAMTMVESFSDFGTLRGYDSARHHKVVRESLLTSTWAQVFADVFYLSMMREYAANPYQDWRFLVSNIVSVPNFRTQHWVRTGGYGDFVTVPEGQTYPALSTPGDEEVAWTIAKRGGIDDVTMESMLGDRTNKVQGLPREMAYAMARSLYKFVLNMATTDNPTMDYDSVALYDAAHANTGTTALTVSGFSATEVAMRSQTRFSTSAEILGPRNLPKIVIVPNELEERAKRIFGPSSAYTFALSSTPDADTSLDPQAHTAKGVRVLVNDYQTDATDWYAMADPNQVDTIIMGFLGGNENPELFVQDQNNVGSVFTADKISYKCRGAWGGEVGEHRSFYRQVVSGS